VLSGGGALGLSHVGVMRELCCDDAAVFVTGDADSYVRALAELGPASHAHSGAVMAANAGSLSHRIARLLGQSRPASRTLSGPGIAAATMLFAMTIVAVFAQPARSADG
jgi:hypothetical protein